MTAFDLKLRTAAGVPRCARTRVVHGVTLAGVPRRRGARGRSSSISAVTASQTVAAAEACAARLPAGSFFLDFNSASPGAKIAAAAHIARGGGRYVEGAVMTAVPPYRIKVPLLLGGPHAAAARAAARTISASPPRSRAPSSASRAPPRCAAA